ncbi:MAG: 4-(cytidine 5'-diphospho)-2-C-methyl-D-erythritol kinase [Vicinamibacterales bacterium]
MASFTLRAFAKINLSLRITSTRTDGFHDVRTILQAIDLFDRVRCEARRGPFQIRCDMPGVPIDGTNLVWKAAQLLWEAAGRDGEARNAVVTLRKSIPMKAGLGGGSSNAAAALLGLRRLWKLPVPDDEIRALAAKLGSDVPFFLVGGTALGLGRGEDVYPLEGLPRYWTVLVIPPFGVATNEAYQWFDEREWPASVSYMPDTWLGRTTPLENDLEAPVTARHPLIGQLKQRLTDRGAFMAAMSGSGSTVFGVFKSAAAAHRAARAIAKEGTRVLTARFLYRLTRRSR